MDQRCILASGRRNPRRLYITGAVVRMILSAFGVTLILTALSFAETMFITGQQIQAAADRCVERHGEENRDCITRGVEQVARMWREEDGSFDEFSEFCRTNFIADPRLREQTADRLETAFESISGHLREMGRDLSWNMAVETGPILPIDYAIARYSPWAHVDEDMFKTRTAFIVLLNYPLYTLGEQLESGPLWTRRQWMEARLAQRFADRIPAEVMQVMTDSGMAAGTYIRDYNIWMHHLLDDNGERVFPEGLKLISHWNLRDELKSLYAESDGLAKQEMIYDVMLRIINQQVPEIVINNPGVDWKLSTNDVVISDKVDGLIPPEKKREGNPGDPVDNTPEPNTRYARFLGEFHAQLMADPYYPTMPTLIDRRFQRDREIPEAEVERLFVSILSSDVVARTGKLIEKRLGRKLQPFDIWYDGFKARATIGEEKLDSIVREKYPTIEAFEADMTRILTDLGFDSATARFVASRVEVDPSRGAGHASGPGRRTDNAHLRTRVPEGGMDYKGYNIATHEFGHNVEQIFSSVRIDHSLLRGVPNTAFTEAFAFVFQARDLELLGLKHPDPQAEHLQVLNDLWAAYEIAGVSLVDMRVWHWMYDHQDATPADLKESVIAIAKDVWNEYYAPVFGVRDIPILAIYSHMISGTMYLPDYPLGHIIAFQIEQYLKEHSIGSEMERMCTIGSVTPDLWMQQAVGGSISTEPMLNAADKALSAVEQL